MDINLIAFEKVSSCPDAIIPLRATSFSAGYDIFTNEECEVQPFQVALIRTGIKVKLPPNTYLQMCLRSSVAINRIMIMPNSPAIIDADYYNNERNEGEILVPILNLSANPQVIDKHSRIAQGIILKYYKVNNDHAMATRVGGVGSSGV